MGCDWREGSPALACTDEWLKGAAAVPRPPRRRAGTASRHSTASRGCLAGVCSRRIELSRRLHLYRGYASFHTRRRYVAEAWCRAGRICPRCLHGVVQRRDEIPRRGGSARPWVCSLQESRTAPKLPRTRYGDSGPGPEFEERLLGRDPRCHQRIGLRPPRATRGGGSNSQTLGTPAYRGPDLLGAGLCLPSQHAAQRHPRQVDGMDQGQRHTRGR